MQDRTEHDPQYLYCLSRWSLVKKDLLKFYGDKLFNSWFKHLFFIRQNEKIVVLGVKTRFHKDWISNNYTDIVTELCKKHDDSVSSIEIVVQEKPDDISDKDSGTESIKETEYTANENVIFSNSLDKRFIFNNFVVGSPNELAYSASRAVAEAASAIPESNPLFLYGGVGLGKTHLMQSIAWHILSCNQDRKFIYISAEKFMYQFVQALRKKNLLSFKEYFRSVDVLMIDDIQFICGKDSTQEEFFHTFNTLIDSHRQMVISCDRSPTDLDNIEDRIKSRLGWGLVADLHSTTYELRIGILQSKIEHINVYIPKEVIEFLAKKVTSNIRELEGSLNKIVAHANLMKSPITLDNTKYLLKDLIKSAEKTITIDEIKRKICQHYKIKMSDMISSIRTREVAQPRQLAMYFTKLFTPKSLTEIGKHFGNKDHTTVMHAIKKIENLCREDKTFENEVSMLKDFVKDTNMN